jgi:hypothetical protein
MGTRLFLFGAIINKAALNILHKSLGGICFWIPSSGIAGPDIFSCKKLPECSKVSVIFHS